MLRLFRACLLTGRALAGDSAGAAAIYVALASAMLFGAGALVVDLGRYMSLHTELQSAADAIALAAAAELNGDDGSGGGDDSITRATRAAAGAFGQNVQTFATDGEGAAVTGYALRFLQTLPTDGTVIGAGDVTTDPLLARFVEVTISPRQISGSLVQILAGPTTLATQATAVAGFSTAFCLGMNLMICNPNESPGGGGGFTLNVGQQILAKTKSGAGQWAPGNFGLLDPPRGGQGTSNISHYLATSTAFSCYNGDFSARPGTANAMRTALNTRFDMYENPGFAGEKNNADYRPARNVTKGKYVPAGGGGGKGGGGGGGGSACSPQAGTAPDAMGLPRDSCFALGTCDRFGEGMSQADVDAYWSVNHGGAAADATPGPVRNWAYSQGLTSTPTAYATPTRYDIYRWEIDNGKIPDGDPSTGTGKENGAPQCYSGSTPPNDTPDRRILNLAVVNCIEEGVNGDGPVNPIAFIRTFLTEPVGGATEAEIYLEVVDQIPQSVVDNAKHDIIQLYR